MAKKSTDRVLVTGGTGFIGSHTVVELQNQGYEVYIIDNLSNSDIRILKGIEKITGKIPVFERIDLCDKAQVVNFFKKYPGINSIIHFAAFKTVSESVQIPLKYYRNNIISLINLLDEVIKIQNANLIFSSSCTVYGQPDMLPVDENAPIKKANSPYGYTKQMSETIIEDTFLSNRNLKSISLRYFNPIGAHESGFIGELPIGTPYNLVPFITQTAYGIHKELKVYGADYDTPDGSCIRDYINVSDLAKAHVVAIERLLSKDYKKNIDVFNIGTGKGISVLEIINKFEKATHQKLNYRIVDRRPGDVEKVWADTKKANKELGWKAEKTLEETLISAWKWEKYYREKF
jgi:UDP-glucose 4-epimerase